MNRIQGILSLLTPVQSIADVGSDHGYVAKAMVDQQLASTVYVTDIAKGPLSRAKKNLLGYPVEFFLMDGLLDFQYPLDSCVIAGMGGELMGKIISGRKDLFDAMEYFVLQPMQHWEELRRFLYEEGYFIEKELMVYEDHYYELLRCKKGEEVAYDFKFSKGLIEDHLLYRNYLREKDENFKHILALTQDRDPKKHQEILEEKMRLEAHCRKLGIMLY